jgi:hypothetical protein
VGLSRPGTLALALLLAGPALWQAFVADQMDASTALLRFLIAVPVSAVMLAVLRGLTGDYRRQRKADKPIVDGLVPARARTDEPAPPAVGPGP